MTLDSGFSDKIKNPTIGFVHADNVYLLKNYLDSKSYSYNESDLIETQWGLVLQMKEGIFKCKNCGATHGMGVHNTTNDHWEPIEVCRNCLFTPKILTDQIIFDDNMNS